MLDLAPRINNVSILIVAARENAKHRLYAIMDLRCLMIIAILITSVIQGAVINLQVYAQNLKIVTPDAGQTENVRMSTFSSLVTMILHLWKMYRHVVVMDIVPTN